MKVLIIDDHRISRLYLRTLLEENFPQIIDIDETDMISSATKLLESNDYNLIFLDMELKDGMGFEVLKVIKGFIYIIVVTHHKEYAIQAFKHNVMDYILKPVVLNEFNNAVNKVVKLYEKDVRSKGSQVPIFKTRAAAEDVLMINYKNEYIAINKKDIVFIKAFGKNSEIHVVNKRHYTSYKNLKEFEIAMTDSFVRIHNSYLVNFKFIESYSRVTSHITLSNGEEIPVSVRKREELFKKFKVF